MVEDWSYITNCWISTSTSTSVSSGPCHSSFLCSRWFLWVPFSRMNLQCTWKCTARKRNYSKWWKNSMNLRSFSVDWTNLVLRHRKMRTRMTARLKKKLSSRHTLILRFAEQPGWASGWPLSSSSQVSTQYYSILLSYLYQTPRRVQWRQLKPPTS